MKFGSLNAIFRRYALALIASIVLPVTCLLAFVFLVELEMERTATELSLYHMRTEALAKSTQLSLNRLKRNADDEEGIRSPDSLSGRIADAHYQIQSAFVESTPSRLFASERFEAVLERINRMWPGVRDGAGGDGSEIEQRRRMSALTVALIQLERLHRFEASAKIEQLHQHGGLSFPRMAGASLLVALVSGTLVWRISLLMGKATRRMDRQAAEARESESRFRQLAENVDAVFWISDIDATTAIFVSPGYERIWGRPVSELSERPDAWVESIHPNDREGVIKGLKSIAGGDRWTGEYRIERPDGTYRWIRDRGFAVKDDDGKVVRLAGVASDVTEEMRMQEKVRDSEGHLRSLMESAQGFVVYRNVSKHSPEHAGTNVFVSPSIGEIMGVTDPERTDSWFENVHEDDLPRIVSAQRKSSEDYLPFREEMRVFHPGRREWRWIRAISHPVHDSSTGQDYFNGIIIDITEEKRFQAELEKAVAEIGKLKELAEAENVYLREEIRHGHLHEDIVGESEALRSVMVEAERVSGTDSTALILGETGTGKELVARAIHRMSDRKDQPLIAVNCAAMPATLVESELFGREKGAYTGALSRQIGRFEAADGGTIFLDEIGELPEATQAKLLRVLEDGQFERLGSAQTISVDVRLIAATNRDLAEDVARGSFREDLYYRLNVFPIRIPALRERREDIPLLAQHFVKEFGEKLGKQVDSISRNTLDRLQEYSWPGNVRELRNLVERGMILARGKALKLEVPRDAEGMAAAATIEDRPLADVERDHILATLERTGWKVRGKGGAAQILGLAPSTLESRMKKRGIERPKTA